MPHGLAPQSREWLKHCGRPMALMGQRQAHAAALLSTNERLKWTSLKQSIRRFLREVLT
jgi:hypothetical protein